MTVTGADGVSRSESFPLVTDPSGSDPTTTLSPDALKLIGPEWTWTAWVEADGVESPVCTGAGPAA
ncbi:hypothetical protein [Cellulomonas citrea]|uniref:hypothetical protein n=1 Tax=Cellulomonas citrea TaxID=1909423 RepID=UPI001359480D|nr:hypothetical protein [Cellulomonas citrea]